MLLHTLTCIVEASESPEGATGQGWQGDGDSKGTGTARGRYLWEELSPDLQHQRADRGDSKMLPQGSPLHRNPMAHAWGIFVGQVGFISLD